MPRITASNNERRATSIVKMAPLKIEASYPCKSIIEDSCPDLSKLHWQGERRVGLPRQAN
jgi:hypothetical protein